MGCSTKKIAQIVRGFAGAVDVYLTNQATGRAYVLPENAAPSAFFPSNEGDAEGYCLAGEVVSQDNGHLRFEYSKAESLNILEGEGQDLEAVWMEDGDEKGLIFKGMLDVVSRSFGA